MDFVLFLLLNAVLFIRPQEIIANFPLENPYVLLVIINLLISSNAVINKFRLVELRKNPLMVMVIGLLISIIVSHLATLNLPMAWEGGIDFVKVVLYYALLVSIVRTRVRLEMFMAALVLFTSILSMLALLQYYEVINIPALESVGDREIDPTTGQEYVLMRICSTGVFHDPNDLACIVLAASWMCVYLAGNRRLGLARHLWLTPLLLFADTFSKTHSRGGFLGLAGSFVVLLIGRFGVRKAVPYLLLGFPVLLILFGGRQTSISASNDTGQQRIKLWAEGFELLKSSPLFGIGWERMDDEVGLVAHNSFIHGFVELGVFGGPLFLGLFYYMINNLYRLRDQPLERMDPELVRVRPFFMAIIAGYAICLLSLTRNYVVPTFMIVGLVGAYFSLLSQRSRFNLPAVTGLLIGQIYGIGIVFVILANTLTRFLVRLD